MGGVTPRQWLKAAGEFTDSHGRGKDNTTFNSTKQTNTTVNDG